MPELPDSQPDVTAPVALPVTPSEPDFPVSDVTTPAATEPLTQAPPQPTESETPTAPQATELQPTETGVSSELSNEDFVRITDFIPDAVIDLRYATENNFTGQVVYQFSQPYLRYGTVKKLMQVQQAVKEAGYRIKIWDGFRPVAAQFRLWEICPDSTYVANPYNGFSSHSRGNTVDITLVYEDGTELEMPTGFDDFTKMADRDFSDCTEVAARNAAYLEQVMVENGFSGYWGEWWHYTDTNSYPVEHNFQPADKE